MKEVNPHMTSMIMKKCRKAGNLFHLDVTDRKGIILCKSILERTKKVIIETWAGNVKKSTESFLKSFDFDTPFQISFVFSNGKISLATITEITPEGSQPKPDRAQLEINEIEISFLELGIYNTVGLGKRKLYADDRDSAKSLLAHIGVTLSLALRTKEDLRA